MRCLNCGNQLPDNAQFCDNCGQRVTQQQASNTQQTSNTQQSSNTQQQTSNTQQTNTCPHCGARVDAGVKFCDNCGKPIAEPTAPRAHYIFCAECGTKMSADEKFCANCGTPVGGRASRTIPSSAEIPARHEEPAKKSPLIIILIVVLAVVLLACGGLVGYNILSDGDSDDTEVTSTASPEVATASPTDGTSITINENSTSEPIAETVTPAPAVITPAVVTPAPTPVFTDVEASSTRSKDTEGGEYSAYSVLDKQPLTKWSPLKSQAGIGSWIKIYASTAQTVRGVYIENGYPKDVETWRKNNRVKEISIEFSDGTVLKRTLADQKEAQQVDFGTAISTTYIKITINSIYSGTKWNDTAIAEITAY